MVYEILNIKGLTLIISPFKDIETSSLGIFLKTGARFEKKSQKGIAHFLEHMLFKGSKNYSYRKIKQEIEGRGGSLNAFTSQEITAYYAHFLNRNTKITLDILLDMVMRPSFKDKEITKERKVILEEIKMYNDLPSVRSIALLDRLLWKNHPLGEEIIGNNQTVEKISKSDLSSFLRKHYQPSNIVISFSGATSKDLIAGLLQEKITKKKASAGLRSFTPFSLQGLHIECEKKKLEQSHLCVGFRSVSYLDKDRLSAQLINVILGANMSSRLFEELREKKPLCYDISTEQRMYHDSGAFIIHMGLNKDKIPVALLAILGQLNKIKEDQVSAKELLRAKDYLLGQFAMSLEQPQSRMFYLAQEYITQSKIADFDSLKKNVDLITPTEIKRVAKNIFKFKDICISCVGNIEDDIKEKLKNTVKKGGLYS